MNLKIEGYKWVKRSNFEQETGQSLRHLFYHCRDELVREGIARKWGKNWLIRPDKLDAFIEAGGTSEISK